MPHQLKLLVFIYHLHVFQFLFLTLNVLVFGCFFLELRNQVDLLFDFSFLVSLQLVILLFNFLSLLEHRFHIHLKVLLGLLRLLLTTSTWLGIIESLRWLYLSKNLGLLMWRHIEWGDIIESGAWNIGHRLAKATLVHFFYFVTRVQRQCHTDVMINFYSLECSYHWRVLPRVYWNWWGLNNLSFTLWLVV